jgi:hypothetical protein
MSAVTPTSPAVDVLQFEAADAPIDLLAERGLPSRMVRPLGDGEITITNLAGESRTLAVSANVDEPVQASAITASDVDLKVYF